MKPIAAEPTYKLAWTLELAELGADDLPEPGKLMRWQIVTTGPMGMMHADFPGFVAFVLEKLCQNACAAIPGLQLEILQGEHRAVAREIS